jgi:hypothetical protein
MRVAFFVSSLIGGVVVVGALMLLQSIMAAFHPGWTLPFSPWWGLIVALPGLMISARRNF